MELGWLYNVARLPCVLVLLWQCLAVGIPMNSGRGRTRFHNNNNNHNTTTSRNNSSRAAHRRSSSPWQLPPLDWRGGDIISVQHGHDGLRELRVSYRGVLFMETSQSAGDDDSDVADVELGNGNNNNDDNSTRSAADAQRQHRAMMRLLQATDGRRVVQRVLQGDMTRDCRVSGDPRDVLDFVDSYRRGAPRLRSPRPRDPHHHHHHNHKHRHQHHHHQRRKHNHHQRRVTGPASLGRYAAYLHVQQQARECREFLAKERHRLYRSSAAAAKVTAELTARPRTMSRPSSLAPPSETGTPAPTDRDELSAAHRRPNSSRRRHRKLPRRRLKRIRRRRRKLRRRRHNFSLARLLFPASSRPDSQSEREQRESSSPSPAGTKFSSSSRPGDSQSRPGQTKRRSSVGTTNFSPPFLPDSRSKPKKSEEMRTNPARTQFSSASAAAGSLGASAAQNERHNPRGATLSSTTSAHRRPKETQSSPAPPSRSRNRGFSSARSSTPRFSRERDRSSVRENSSFSSSSAPQPGSSRSASEVQYDSGGVPASPHRLETQISAPSSLIISTSRVSSRAKSVPMPPTAAERNESSPAESDKRGSGRSGVRPAAAPVSQFPSRSVVHHHRHSSNRTIHETMATVKAAYDDYNTDNYNYMNATSRAREGFRGDRSSVSSRHLRRQKRDLMSGWFIFPGTKWCGDGDIAEHSGDLGYDEALDSCCRAHDMCRHVIHRLSWKYSLFNFRLHTLSHCRCDRRFRKCLKKSTSPSAHMVGKIYFNVIGPQCFKFTKTKTCKRRNWWGKCKKYGYTKVAHPKKQRSF